MIQYLQKGANTYVASRDLGSISTLRSNLCEIRFTSVELQIDQTETLINVFYVHKHELS